MAKAGTPLPAEVIANPKFVKGNLAIPVRGLSVAKIVSGASMPIRVVQPHELQVNGGEIFVSPIEPIQIVDLTTQRKVRGGQAQLVYPVDEAGAFDRTFPLSPYMSKILSIESDSLIGYWPMQELSGSIAYDASGQENNGAYIGVTLGQPGIGDGLTCPLYDGVNDVNDIYSVGSAADFNGDEGTVELWLKMRVIGVWTDGIARWAFVAYVNGDNHIYLYKSSAANTFIFKREAQNVIDQVAIGGLDSIDWLYFAITWSVLDDEVIAYINGVQVGATQVGLQAFVGTPVSTNFCIGALNNTPASVTDGYEAHVRLRNIALTPAQILSGSVV